MSAMNALVAALAAASYVTVENDDTGTLAAGKTPVQKGDAIIIEGETQPRAVSNVMGSVERGNLHVCCKNTGAFPKGTVSFAVLPGMGDQVVGVTLPAAPQAKVFSRDELTEQAALLEEDIQKAS